MEGFMFQDLIRDLKSLERGVRIPIEIPLDEKGYMDRECPDPDCLANFKVLYEDWREKVSDERVFCPICRHEAESTEWNTEEQVEYIRRVGTRHVGEIIQQGLSKSARRFNQSQPRNSFLKISMSHRPGQLPSACPPEACEPLRQDFECETCECRYSAVGVAFFCPACGHNSAGTTFAASLQTVRSALGNLDAIQNTLTEATDADTAANFVRHTIEDGLVKLVGSFQRYAEALFSGLPSSSAINVPKNVFQRLQDSSNLWRQAVGHGYEGLLEAGEIAELQVFFQQRHLLSHKEGIVDQEYLNRSSDGTYDVGQRLLVRRQAVHRLIDLLEKLATGLRALC